MSTKDSKIIAIACADIHLMHEPPIWRSNEPDWYVAMARPLDEISELQRKYECPVLCAGDIFDKWNSPAELINFALKVLPNNMYAVPGQHDIPNHNIQELARSAFSSLTLASKITWMYEYGLISDKRNIDVYAVPFGHKLQNHIRNKNKLNIAILHEYVCIKGSDYKGAPKDSYIVSKGFTSKKYAGYDIVIYGDNHKGFKTHLGKTIIVNCGSVMRLHKDQIDYKPKVWLIYSDGDVIPYYLDISKDVHLTADEMKELPTSKPDDMKMANFAKELKKLGTSALDFSDAIERYCKKNNIDKDIKDLVMKAMER